MKKVLIFLATLLISCNASNKLLEPQSTKMVEHEEMETYVEYYPSDDYNSDYIDTDEDFVGSVSSPEPVIISNMIMYESNTDDKDVYIKESIKQPISTAGIIIDKVDRYENKGIDESMNGEIAYSVPDTMTVGESYNISLRITKEQLGIENFTAGMNKNDTPATIIIESIRIGGVMTAKLFNADSTFFIQPLSTLEQSIDDFGFTEWEWLVKPLNRGDNRLKMIVKVRVYNENGSFLKDIPVYDQKIVVHSNIKWTVKEWIKSYWQWLMTTIIIPIFLFFWKKRKKE